MKLQLIVEADDTYPLTNDEMVDENYDSLNEERDEIAPLVEDEYANRLSLEMTSDNLITTSLSKLRDMLGAMGLVKGGQQKHRVSEPVGAAVAAFSQLREVVRRKASRDADAIRNRSGNKQAIGDFWGFQIPTNYYDIDASHAGRANKVGTFDILINDTVDRSMNRSTEGKIQLLHDMITAFK